MGVIIDMLFISILIYTTFIYQEKTNQVSLYDIPRLDFYKTKLTNEKNPQIICTGDNLDCQLENVKEVFCINLLYKNKNEKNENNKNVTWECNAELPSHYKFKKTEVVCKGDKDNKDNLVDKYSCFLEYELKFNISYILWCIFFLLMLSFMIYNDEYDIESRRRVRRSRGNTYSSKSIAKTRIR